MTSAMEKGTRFFVCYVLLTTVVVVVVSNEECLKCWNMLCEGDNPTPPPCTTRMIQCIDYDNINRDEGQLIHSHDCCCDAARGYVNYTVNQSLAPQMQESGGCRSVYNEEMEMSFNIDRFSSDLSVPFEYVLPDIQFNCTGCISNITFYTKSQTQTHPDHPLLFNILLWGSYKQSTDNSSVFVLRNNYSINVTDQLSFMEWPQLKNEGFRTTISIEKYNICFDPGNVFGISVPGGVGSFNLDIFKEKDTNMTTTVYARSPPSCSSLGSVWFPRNSRRMGNALIAVGVREQVVSPVTTAVATTTTTTATVFPTSPSISSYPASNIQSLVISTFSTPGDPTSHRPSPTLPSTPSPTHSPTPTATSTAGTSPPAAAMSIAAIAAGVAVCLIAVSLIVAFLFVCVCVVQRQNKKNKHHYAEPHAVGTSTSFQLMDQVSSPTQHAYDLPNNFFDESMNINDYDDPNELNRIAFQPNHVSMTPIAERDTLHEDNYTDMSGSHADGPLQAPHYQVPRSALPRYDIPRKQDETNWGSDYDDPTILDNIQQGRVNKHHHYFALEDTRRAGDNKKEHNYQVLEQANPSSQEPIYFVLEPGFLVPRSDERQQWATGSGGSQDSVISNRSTQVRVVTTME